MPLKSYRELRVWQAAMDLVVAVYRVTKMWPDSERFALTNQAQRAAVSVPSNIAEGYGRFHKADKKNFYVNARASVNECVACADIIFDSKTGEDFLLQSEILAKMLSGLIKYFKE